MPVDSIKNVLDQNLTFVNRQRGSGTRLLLDGLMKEQHIRPEQLSGYYHEEHTHLAVASMIVSRQADAGIGIESVAKKLNLHFFPLNQECYFLVFRHFNTEVQQVLEAVCINEKISIIDYKAFNQLLCINNE